ncbi:ethanolaminephosphotransferase 1-like [Galleria mellonella]|uniref:Ethanolaminephosphotransferase 1-like n=1 Tax=Galleria mellonella TaxID=7137 RepID=A0A6J1WBB6_GALME|nr:ethanolaminephosphotransferase 1-like [Galleria mellonella]
MFNYKYLSQNHLKGFDKYKYSAIDTSPLSNYVMHPSWNYCVQFIPKWIAPNLLTFAGFVCMVIDVVILSIYDYKLYASGGPADRIINETELPFWVYPVCGLLLFLAYNLDGIDGKQARRIGVSGPLGEMFDHGLDSYIVFLIPYCLVSLFGRDHDFSIPTFRGFLLCVSITLNFYTSHCEKYSTGTLFLPWGYDLSMWVATILFLVPYFLGRDVYKFYMFGDITFVQFLEVLIHATGLFTTLPVAIYNVYLYRKSQKSTKMTLLQAFKPVWSMLTMILILTTWALHSPNDIMLYDPRAFFLLYGTLFSNISSRLIVAIMGSQRCEAVCWLSYPLLVSTLVSLTWPAVEIVLFYGFTLIAIGAHVHYGICVVQQICSYLKIKCFVVPKEKIK